MSELDSLLTRLNQRDRRALSRLLTLAARGEESAAIRRALPTAQNQTRVVALTGSGGVGKSTLVGKLVELGMAKGKSVAVLACDPESPITGGALLGDRVRMSVSAEGEAPFIRSLAAAAGHQALAEHLDLMIALLEAYGFDLVILETVGAGQGDTAIRSLVDVLVLLLQPEAGDDLQWEKAGLLEVADAIVIHKADLPGADRVEAQVRGQVDVPGLERMPVLKVSSAKKQGLEELWQTITTLPSRKEKFLRDRRHLIELVHERLSEQMRASRGVLDDVLSRWQRNELSDDAAVEEVLKRLRD